jgi:hypothetical protein
MQQEHVRRRAGACTLTGLTAGVWVGRYKIGAKDRGGFCGHGERPMQGERDKVVGVSDAREDEVRYARVDEL